MKSISVVIPCYNCCEFIDDTLESLVNQTCQDFEVICINDGSTDLTLSVLEKWKNCEAFDMQIVNQENGGVSRARNAGIHAAKGEYILFLDSDDMYHPRYIECLYNATMQYNVDVAYCRLSRDLADVTRDYERVPMVCQTQKETMHDLLYRMSEFAFCCYLYQKEILIRENIVFDIGTKHFEDREFNWKYLCHCKTAVLVDAPLYFYRVNVNSVTQNRKVQWRTDGLDAVKRIETYMDKINCSFLPELKDYLFPRVMWAMAKNYSLGGEKDLLIRLGKEYDVKVCMKRTAKDSNKLVALASWLYLIHPLLFYYVVRLRK